LNYWTEDYSGLLLHDNTKVEEMLECLLVRMRETREMVEISHEKMKAY
jgi:hypothetical protein